MKTVKNTSLRPLRIGLPGGKTLFLGGLRQAKVRDDALEHPALKKLLEAGTVEVVDGVDGKRATSGTSEGSGKGGGGQTHGSRAKPQSGDR